MKKISAISAIAACALMGGAGIASAQTTSAGAMGGGTAVAGDKGAVATGGGAAGSATADRTHRKGRDRHERRTATTPAPAASTYGSGSVYTDRDNTSAAVTSGGAATGTGANTSSTVDAYGETTRSGTSADIYGNSTAGTSTTTPRR